MGLGLEAAGGSLANDDEAGLMIWGFPQEPPYEYTKWKNAQTPHQKLHKWFYFSWHGFTERGCLRPWAWGWRPVAVWLMMMTMMMRPLQPQLSEGKVLIRLPIRRVISAPLF